MVNDNSKIELMQQWKVLLATREESYKNMAKEAVAMNPWFIESEIDRSLKAIAQDYLDDHTLHQWILKYQPKEVDYHKSVGIVAAGNIPFVVFHDLICAIFTGRKVYLKLAEKDTVIPTHYLRGLKKISENLVDVEIIQKLPEVDAYIITGSSLALNHYKNYLKGKPAIMRGHRNSIAILDGNENDDELTNLGFDVFSYFGLGCRNVSKLFLPVGYDLSRLFKVWDTVFNYLIDVNVYYRNYDYQKALKLVNRVDFLDTGYVMFEESKSISPPLATVFYEYYRDNDELKRWIHENEERLQCIVANSSLDFQGSVAFGRSQHPGLWDYQDNLDTMEFLIKS